MSDENKRIIYLHHLVEDLEEDLVNALTARRRLVDALLALQVSPAVVHQLADLRVAPDCPYCGKPGVRGRHTVLAKDRHAHDECINAANAT